jgi:hypothetical protein
MHSSLQLSLDATAGREEKALAAKAGAFAYDEVQSWSFRLRGDNQTRREGFAEKAGAIMRDNRDECAKSGKP